MGIRTPLGAREFFSFPYPFRPSLAPTFTMGIVAFARGQNGRGVALTSHLHLSPTLGMSGAIPLLPSFMPSLHVTERFYVQREWAFFFTWGARDVAGPNNYASIVGVSEFVDLVTCALLHNTLLSVYMKRVAGTVKGDIALA